MAEETKEEPKEEPKSGGLGRIIFIVGVVLVAAIAGLATYQFLLAPLLSEPEDVAQSDPQEFIPVAPVMLEFPQTPVNVIREGEMPASTLLFGVTLECENAETAALVSAHRPRFLDMINKLHDSRTRAELDDVLLIKESIQRQALQKCNDILKRLQEEPSENIRITSVFHHTFVVQDAM